MLILSLLIPFIIGSVFLLYTTVHCLCKKYRLISLIRRCETQQESILLIISDLKFGYSIDSDSDTRKFVQKFRSIEPDRPIDLILHTTGGSSTNSKIMIDTLLNHKGPIRAYIPFEAYSAGTLIALTADELHIHTLAHLSKIDSQMVIDRQLENGIPVGLMRTVKKINSIHSRLAEQFYNDDLCTLAAIFKKGTYDKYQQTQIINYLVNGSTSHGYPLSFNEIKEIGLNIDNNIPSIIEEILREHQEIQ